MFARYLPVLLGFLLPGIAVAQSKAEPAHVEAAVRHLEAAAFAQGVPTAEVSALDAVPGAGATHVYLRQTAEGIGIVGTEATVSVGRSGRVVHVAGAERLTSVAATLSKTTTPTLSAADAARAAARHNGFAVQVSGDARSDAPDRAVTLRDGDGERVPARLVYQPDAAGALQLAWEVEIGGEGQLWLARVDAATGAVLDQVDLVTHDTFGPAHAQPGSLAPLATAPAPALPAPSLAGSYTVFAMPLEAPYYGSRSAVANPDDAAASPFGWHDTNGAAGAEYTVTRGNNVHAYTDLDANNSPDAGSSPDGGGALTFNFPLDLSQGPSTYRPAAVTNLFYWNNVIHDVLWHYGFDEASGNFQVNTYGRGGAGNDDVRAEAQDGSGVNNANFATPSDGGRPRMQMFVGTYPNPDVDGDFDNGVVVHEYGHGVSNRLTGGRTQAGCLGNREQMGEGWSDWYGLMLTMDAGDSSTQARGIGNYLFGYGANGGGIRLAPYSTSFGTNDYTYGRTTSMSAVHQVGFVWATALWEVTWDMIDAHGFSPDLYDGAGTAGNQIMLRLVTEGMKYQPCNPGFVSGRDGILAAEQAIYGGAYAATLQAAFARRGLGYSANQGSSNATTDNVEAFDLWPGGGGGNADPVAGFSASCTDLTCQFTDASSDADGTITSRSWTFGDGSSSSATNPSRTFGAAGSYTVTLTVTDDAGATDQAQQTVTVTTPGGNPIALTVTTSTHRRKGNRADLSWSPADGGRVDVYRNGAQIRRTRDNGSYRDSPSGSGPFTYQVCETDSGDCSNEETVSFLDGDGFAGDAVVDTEVRVAPNPFTAETTIRFGLAAEGNVTLEVYNAIGQRVAVLADGFHAEGTHRARFDASALPAGVYVYRLRTTGGIQTGRLLVAR